MMEENPLVDITSNQVKEAVARFLEQEMEKKEKSEAAREQYELDNWMEMASEKFAKGIQFGTHTSKGVHTSSKGDSIRFEPQNPLPEGLVGTQTIADELPLDASGNSNSLPLSGLFETWVDEKKGISLRNLIEADHPSLEGMFATDPLVSRVRRARFKSLLESGAPESPKTDSLNKQLLWPLHKAVEGDYYCVLVPLHPASLANAVYMKIDKINRSRFETTHKEAEGEHGEKVIVKAGYSSIPDLAVIHLGGKQPQNAGKLSARQKGIMYHLPSFPPISSSSGKYAVGPKEKSFFNKKLAYRCREGLSALYGVIRAGRNTYKVRTARQSALDAILGEVLTVVEDIQQNNAPGWSRGYSIPMAEKYWLDPRRALLEGENVFLTERNISSWHEEVSDQFAFWINQLLKKEFPKLSFHIGDDEHREWMREIADEIKSNLRAGRELFA